MSRRLIRVASLWLRTLPQSLGLCLSLLRSVVTSGARVLWTVAFVRPREDGPCAPRRELLRAWLHMAGPTVQECRDILRARLLTGLAVPIWGIFAVSGLCLCKLLPEGADAIADDSDPVPRVFESIEDAIDALPATRRGNDIVFH